MCKAQQLRYFHAVFLRRHYQCAGNPPKSFLSRVFVFEIESKQVQRYVVATKGDKRSKFCFEDVQRKKRDTSHPSAPDAPCTHTLTGYPSVTRLYDRSCIPADLSGRMRPAYLGTPGPRQTRNSTLRAHVSPRHLARLLFAKHWKAVLGRLILASRFIPPASFSSLSPCITFRATPQISNGRHS